MGDKKLHPVRFSEEQVKIIKHMIYASRYGIDEASDDREKDILSTIEKSVIGKPWIPPFIPPGQGKTEKCYHINIRFSSYQHTQVCPDCHTVVWPSDMINIILDAISSHIFHYNRLPGS